MTSLRNTSPSSLSLAIADYIIQMTEEGEDCTYDEIESRFGTRFVRDKVRSLVRHGFVVAEDCRGRLEIVHDPRSKQRAA